MRLRWIGAACLAAAFLLLIAGGGDEDVVIPAVLLAAGGVWAWYRGPKREAVRTAEAALGEETAARLARMELMLEGVQSDLQQMRETRDFFERLYGDAVAADPARLASGRDRA